MATPLLDRDVELAALTAELTAARSGAGRVVVVEGPAGIGKTSLLAATAELARAGGATVLRARAGPLEQPFAFGVARQLYAPLRASDEWSELSTGAATLASRALDEHLPEPANAEDAVHAAAHGLVWLSLNLAERGPCALVVDDLQWADAPSLRWLAQLARRLDELPLALVCAVRTGEPTERPELLAEVLAAAETVPVRPRPLGPAATAVVVRQRLPRATDGFAEACHGVCGGNPFLVRALVAQVEAEGLEPDDATAARLTTFGAEQVARSVELQLERLADGAADLARALAVLDAPGPLRHAAGLARLELAQATRLADALRSCGLVGPGTQPELAHPIISAALYTALPPGERSLWHARAARLLAHEQADPERIALHVLRTEPAGDADAVELLRAAAARASTRGAPETAAAYLRRALEEPPADRATEATVRLELGLALTARLEHGCTDYLREAVELSDDPALRGEAAVRGIRGAGLASLIEEAIEIAETALADTEGMPPEAIARLEAEAIIGRMTTATSARAAKRLREPLVPRETLDLWRIAAAMEATFAGDPGAEVLALLEPVLEKRALAAEPDSVLNTIAGVGLAMNDALAAAVSHCDEAIDAARPRGWVTTVAHASYVRALARHRQGALREAEADARFSYEFKVATLRVPLALMWTLAPLLDVLLEADRLDEADAIVSEAPLPDSLPRNAATAAFLQRRGALRHLQARNDEALADLREAAALYEELELRHPVLGGWRVPAVPVLAQLGETAEARRLATEQVALAERVATPGALATALCTQALVASRRDRVGLLERAVAVSAPGEAQLEHWRALVELGAALRRVGRRADAREPLRAALDLTARAGAVRLARRADEELRAAGARPRRAFLSGPESLTGAEHRVATLAAQGHTNRQIAQALFVSRRTVETHLAHAFQKLGISGRDELAHRLAA